MTRKKKMPFIATPKIPRVSPRVLNRKNESIEAYLGFDAIDLQANMEGNITNLQLKRLSDSWWSKFLSLVIGLPVILFSMYGCIGFAALPVLLHDNLGIVCLSLFGLYLMIYVIREGWQIIQLARDIREHQVRWVVGQAKKSTSLFYLTRDYIVIDGLKFAVDPQERGCFRLALLGQGSHYHTDHPFYRDESYAVYYVPHSKTIISAKIGLPADYEARLEQSVITMGADGEIEVG